MTWTRHLRRMLAVLTACWLLALWPASAEDAKPDPGGPQILVMLKIAPPHFRPGGNYGGAYGDTMSAAARRRTALRIARRNGLALVDSWEMPILAVDCYVMRLPAGTNVDDAIRQVSHDPAVAWSQPLQTYQARGSSATGDPLYPVQPAARAWRLADLQRISTGKGISVAIIDSKVEVDHPDLAGRFAAVRDFVSDGRVAAEAHGTGIAGVIGAKAGNGIGIAGVAPDARLLALRACHQTIAAGTTGPTLCDSLSLARALQFAIERNAQIINMSLSGPPDELLTRLLQIALSRKMSVVAAFDPALPSGGFPASLPGVVAVADQALRSLPERVYTAPGQDVMTTQPGGIWYLVNGSSYAAAHVSGLIALVRQHGSGGASVGLVRSRGNAIDACATLVRTSARCDCSCALALRLDRH